MTTTNKKHNTISSQKLQAFSDKIRLMIFLFMPLNILISILRDYKYGQKGAKIPAQWLQSIPEIIKSGMRLSFCVDSSCSTAYLDNHNNFYVFGLSRLSNRKRLNCFGPPRLLVPASDTLNRGMIKCTTASYERYPMRGYILSTGEVGFTGKVGFISAFVKYWKENKIKLTEMAISQHNLIFLDTQGKVYSISFANCFTPRDDEPLKKNVKLLQFSKDSKITSIVAGSDYIVALSERGEVYTCGKDQHGALGHGALKEQVTPMQITFPTKSKIIKIAAKHSVTVCLDSTGAVYTFGKGDHGQLGHGDSENQCWPKHVTPLPTIVDITTSGEHTACLSDNGKVYTFGLNESSVLGYYTEEEYQATPKQIKSIKNLNVVTLAASKHVSLFGTSDGHIYSCGSLHGRGLGYSQSRHVLTGPILTHEFHELRERLLCVAKGKGRARYKSKDSGSNECKVPHHIRDLLQTLDTGLAGNTYDEMIACVETLKQQCDDYIKTISSKNAAQVIKTAFFRDSGVISFIKKLKREFDLSPIWAQPEGPTVSNNHCWC